MCCLFSLSKQQNKIIPLLFRLGLGARKRILTDVSIMVMAKSCLYQTQHSGLTITANGHICHGTKMSVLSVCAVCVFALFCICVVCVFLEDTFTQQNKSQLVPTCWAENSFLLTGKDYSPLMMLVHPLIE